MFVHSSVCNHRCGVVAAVVFVRLSVTSVAVVVFIHPFVCLEPSFVVVILIICLFRNHRCSVVAAVVFVRLSVTSVAVVVFVHSFVCL